VLVECGFISNKDDLQILKTKPGEIAKQISNGIVKYLGDR
jgi:N-acetylmuramoyl-L-alanine amidase